jgi:hypothetical protein
MNLRCLWQLLKQDFRCLPNFRRMKDQLTTNAKINWRIKCSRYISLTSKKTSRSQKSSLSNWKTTQTEQSRSSKTLIQRTFKRTFLYQRRVLTKNLSISNLLKSEELTYKFTQTTLNQSIYSKNLNFPFTRSSYHS